MDSFLILRFDAPMQAWGDVALDPRRPTRSFPSRSALGGLLANALGWMHADVSRITELQDSVRYAVREDVTPVLMTDYQTADLDAQAVGWTRWGIEGTGKGTQLLWKDYLADGIFTVALRLEDNAPVTLDDVEEALRNPARPLFLGRKCCPPATPLLIGRIEGLDAVDALSRTPLFDPTREEVRIWCDPHDGQSLERATVSEVWDRRNYRTTRFDLARHVVQGYLRTNSSGGGDA